MQFNGFGSGSDGAVTLSGTDSPVDSACSGSSGATSLTATNASFADDKLILIHQTRGTSAGSWELNFIESYSAGTITTQFDLVNTYSSSGSNRAQVIQLKEYASVTIASSTTLTVKPWDGDVGGILSFLCSGEVLNNGSINADGANGYAYDASSAEHNQNGGGFRGGGNDDYTGIPDTGGNGPAHQGEGTSGLGTVSVNQNGNGGGGGGTTSGNGNGGAGGSNGTNGTSGGGASGGVRGDTAGSADLSTMVFGGGGGGAVGAGGNDAGGYGGNGGGIIAIWAGNITNTGSILARGGAGGSGAGSTGSGGGGGAGGSILLVATSISNTGSILATGGNGSAGSASGSAGGNGGSGRVHIETCDYTGSDSSPAADLEEGGHDFCQTFIHVSGE